MTSQTPNYHGYRFPPEIMTVTPCGSITVRRSKL